MILKKVVTLIFVLFLMPMLFSNAVAHDMVHNAEYNLMGRLDLIQVTGSNHGSGAQRNLSISGDGHVEKVSNIVQQRGSLKVDDSQSWVTALDALNNLKVISATELSAPPQLVFTTTRYVPLNDDDGGSDEATLHDVVFIVEGNSRLAGVSIQVYSDSLFKVKVGDSVITDANGIAVKRLPKGDYWFKATKAGFQGLEGSFMVTNEGDGEGSLDIDFTMIIEDCRKDPQVDEAVLATAVFVGDKVGESLLSGAFKDADSGAEVAGVLSWSDADLAVVESGYFEWVFTPTDCTAYNATSGVVFVEAKCRPAEKAALGAEILIAETYLDSVTVSTDGKDVPRDELWVTGLVWGAYSLAVEEAQRVYDDLCADQTGVDQTVADLQEAKAIFKTHLSYGLLPETVTIAGLEGVEVPVKGAIPVSVIIANDQFTGAVTWAPAYKPFLPETVYTATITLTPKEGYTLTGVAENFFTVAGAASVANRVDSGEVVAVFPVTDAIIYAIGDKGPSGVGIVFYITDGGRHGLEAAPSGWGGANEPKDRWKINNTRTSGTQKNIGSGYANTYAHMVGAEHPAAAMCRDYRYEFEGDWFLPSLDELNQMYLHKAIIGGFDTAFYWSSTDADNFNSWVQSFRFGGQIEYSKISAISIRLRPIRAF